MHARGQHLAYISFELGSWGFDIFMSLQRILVKLRTFAEFGTCMVNLTIEEFFVSRQETKSCLHCMISVGSQTLKH